MENLDNKDANDVTKDIEVKSETTPSEEKASPFDKKSINKKAALAGIGIACLIAALGVVGAYSHNNSPSNTASAIVKQNNPSPKTSDEKTQYQLYIGVKADGWKKDTSSPVIMHVVNKDKKVDFYHAYDANTQQALMVPEQGNYEVSFISPINADGSMYKVPAPMTLDAMEKTDVGSSVKLYSFTKVDTKDVTKEQLTSLASQVAEALEKGDKTLAADAGVKVMATVKRNAKANKNVDVAAVEKEAKKGEEAAKANTAEQAATRTESNPASNSRPSTNGGNSSGGSQSAKPEEPKHEHNWVAEYKTVHHDAQYKTVHHDAVYETRHHDAVTEERSICNNCGEDITGHTDAHMEDSLINGDGQCQSYSIKPVVVQPAWDEQVLVQKAWDEQVQTAAAWDEQVPTGTYKCSGCGATK